MSEPNKDGTDIMMALLMGLSGPRASKAWNESQQIKAESFLTMAEHWINQTAEENARLKAEVERLKAEPDALAAYLYADTLRRDDIKTLKAHIERLTKAGDAMVDMVDWEVPYERRKKLEADWNAAKEGKQSK
jgi:predicted RNase H-like nuclease (RuvC/YqgF family)